MSTRKKITVIDDSKVTIDYLDQTKVGDPANDYVAIELKDIELDGVDTIYISLKHIHDEEKLL
jgi:hypothetical protein